ncbi:hypothetical protein [Phosphitispora fastidiosa]|uniref:hypothetical protein n=1 Tax=Phosphitispora fastidiosa TaxID=2837202 RepID=UPI001E3C6577|nr:hypothetical protein [Phosphitispora fastidiosa]MBU7006172.1 chromosome segregation ATPase [Phosphitispora fastidiosa]
MSDSNDIRKLGDLMRESLKPQYVKFSNLIDGFDNEHNRLNQCISEFKTGIRSYNEAIEVIKRLITEIALKIDGLENQAAPLLISSDTEFNSKQCTLIKYEIAVLKDRIAKLECSANIILPQL